MPVTIKKKAGGKYQVSTPHGVHAYGTTLQKALAQKKIIDAAEHGHSFTGKHSKAARPRRSSYA